jgi:ATPase subunit of ABC transporter with duplicated ATPase domains
LPSIEELEAALRQYRGALLYISHDSYLAKHLGGEQLTITPL